MPMYAFLRGDGSVALTLERQNDAAAAAHANMLALDWERLNGQETKPDDLVLIVPGDAVITYPPPTLPPKRFVAKNRGEIQNLRQRRQNGQSITYPVLVEGRDGGILTIPDQTTLDSILAASAGA